MASKVPPLTVQSRLARIMDPMVEIGDTRPFFRRIDFANRLVAATARQTREARPLRGLLEDLLNGKPLAVASGGDHTGRLRETGLLTVSRREVEAAARAAYPPLLPETRGRVDAILRSRGVTNPRSIGWLRGSLAGQRHMHVTPDINFRRGAVDVINVDPIHSPTGQYGWRVNGHPWARALSCGRGFDEYVNGGEPLNEGLTRLFDSLRDSPPPLGLNVCFGGSLLAGRNPGNPDPKLTAGGVDFSYSHSTSLERTGPSIHFDVNRRLDGADRQRVKALVLGLFGSSYAASWYYGAPTVAGVDIYVTGDAETSVDRFFGRLGEGQSLHFRFGFREVTLLATLDIPQLLKRLSVPEDSRGVPTEEAWIAAALGATRMGLIVSLAPSSTHTLMDEAHTASLFEAYLPTAAKFAAHSFVDSLHPRSIAGFGMLPVRDAEGYITADFLDVPGDRSPAILEIPPPSTFKSTV